MGKSKLIRPDNLRVVSFAAAFFAATAATIFWTRYSGGLALFWPGTAIAAAMFLSLPYRNWAGPTALLLVLSTIATALFGFGPVAAVPLAFVNIGEALLTAYLLRRWRPQGDYIESGPGIVALSAIAGFAAPLVMSLPGSFIAWQVVGGSWLLHAAGWLVGHGLGALLVMPLALLLVQERTDELVLKRSLRQSSGRTAELIAIVALVGGISVATIFQTKYPLLFLPIVPVVLASYRFGRLGGALGVLIVTVTAAASLALDIGHFAALDLTEAGKALFLQFYLAVLLLIALPLAIALKQRERLLADIVQREALQRLIADHSDDALLHLDRDGSIRFASPASHGLSGHDDLVGRPMAAFFGAFDAEVVDEALAAARNAPGTTRIIERSVTRGHATLWLEAKIRAVYSAGAVRSFVVTIRDVTARKLDELQAAREARTDALTGLPNRRAFLDMIERHLSEADNAPFALALIDLDHFKRVNDTYGHDAGDSVLKRVAGLMREHTTRTC
ncbi:MAG: MASE1 domain-containing protein, partial [Erythrobacter sp.]|nr:MASE1 domain-containing protein [Erythrobacter sp.]